MLLELLVLVNINQVLDGDTLKTSTGEKIRLSKIDCPELKQPFGQEAKEFTSVKVLDKVVTLDCGPKDLYGRTLGYILLDDGILNEELVNEGMAWSYKSAKYKKLEARARDLKRGLWAADKPENPAIFRARQKLKRVVNGSR